LVACIRRMKNQNTEPTEEDAEPVKKKKKSFMVTAVVPFEVIPLCKNKEYIILEISDDGLKWKAKDTKGRVGWVPAHYMRPLDPEEFPVPGFEKKKDPLEGLTIDPNIKIASTDLLSFLDDYDRNPEAFVTTANASVKPQLTEKN